MYILVVISIIIRETFFVHFTYEPVTFKLQGRVFSQCIALATSTEKFRMKIQ